MTTLFWVLVFSIRIQLFTYPTNRSNIAKKIVQKFRLLLHIVATCRWTLLNLTTSYSKISKKIAQKKLLIISFEIYRVKVQQCVRLLDDCGLVRGRAAQQRLQNSPTEVSSEKRKCQKFDSVSKADFFPSIHTYIDTLVFRFRNCEKKNVIQKKTLEI